MRVVRPWVVLLLLAASPALAAPFDECLSADESFDYERALTACQAAVDAAQERPDERAQALAVLAAAQAHLGKKRDAQRTYRALLTLDPAFVPSDMRGPKVRKWFKQARRRWRRKARLRIEHDLPDLGPPMVVRYRIVDKLDRIARADVVLTPAAGEPVTVALREGDKDGRRRVFEAALPALPEGDWTYALALYAATERAIEHKQDAGTLSITATRAAEAKKAERAARDADRDPSPLDPVLEERWPSPVNAGLAAGLGGGVALGLTALGFVSLFAGVGPTVAVVMFALAPIAGAAAATAFVRPLLGPLVVAVVGGGTAAAAIGLSLIGSTVFFSPTFDKDTRGAARWLANGAYVVGLVAIPVATGLVALAVAAPGDEDDDDDDE